MPLKNLDEFKTEIDPKTDTPHRIMGAFMTSAYLLMINLVPLWDGPVGHA